MLGFRRSTLEKPPEKKPTTPKEDNIESWFKDQEITKQKNLRPWKTAEEFDDRVTWGRYKEFKFNAEKMAQVRKDFKGEDIKERLFFAPDILREKYRQYAIQFLTKYQDNMTFNEKIGVGLDTLVSFASEVIRNTQDLEEKMPSKGLEAYLKGKDAAPKRAIA